MKTIEEMYKLGFVVIKSKDGYVIVDYKGYEKEVVIPDDVVRIAYKAFANKGLTSVKFPDSLKVIDWGAFAFNNLTELDFNNVDEVGDLAFANNKLEKVNLDNVNVSGNWIFGNNPIQEVEIIDVTTTSLECE